MKKRDYECYWVFFFKVLNICWFNCLFFVLIIFFVICILVMCFDVFFWIIVEV